MAAQVYAAGSAMFADGGGERWMSLCGFCKHCAGRWKSSDRGSGAGTIIKAVAEERANSSKKAVIEDASVVCYSSVKTNKPRRGA